MTGIIEKFLVPAIGIIITTATLFIVRGMVFRLLHARAEKTDTEIDDIVIKSVKMPSLYWILALGLYAGLLFSDLPEKYVFFFSKASDAIYL